LAVPELLVVVDRAAKSALYAILGRCYNQENWLAPNGPQRSPEVTMDSPYQGAPDVHVFPVNLPLPGVGVLPINAYVLMAEEPVLIVAAVSSVVDLEQLKWIWLTHDDADHTGSIQRVMELAPNARLVTHAMGALRMATWWPVPLDRVHAIRFGDDVHVGDRTLTAIAPPLFDNPTSTGVLDRSTGALFSVDSFGAILPEPAENVDDIPREVLAGGMVGWATSDSPWAHVTDRMKFGEVLDKVRQLQPTRIFSSHLPAASGTSTEDFLAILETVPDAEPFMPPNADEFVQLIDAMAAEQRAGALPEQRETEQAAAATLR
jgi:glyoxylase-like metal-dependent hydrolase (beta-lactamase superfamily II)